MCNVFGMRMRSSLSIGYDYIFVEHPLCTGRYTVSWWSLSQGHHPCTLVTMDVGHYAIAPLNMSICRLCNSPLNYNICTPTSNTPLNHATLCNHTCSVDCCPPETETQSVISIASSNSGWTAGAVLTPLKLLECDKPIISNQEGLPGVYYWL